jgi:hypothetical protein
MTRGKEYMKNLAELFIVDKLFSLTGGPANILFIYLFYFYLFLLL